MIGICLGGAKTVWDELAEAKALIGDRPHVLIACNHAALQYEGRLDTWVTLHPELIDGWVAERAAAGREPAGRVFAHKPVRGSIAEPLSWRWFGSSGLYTAQVAFDRMGCSHAILCGVPMDNTGGHIHWGGDWEFAYHYHQGIREIGSESAAIRSMSGWTREYFGYPDTEWLDQIPEIEGIAA